MRHFRMAVLGAAVMITAAGAAEVPQRLAVLPLELNDTSGEAPNPEQERRLRLLDAELLARLAASDRYVPVAAALPAGAPSVRNCNRCDVVEAQQVGAGLVLTGVVHKVSNLILDLTLILREVPSGTDRGVWRAEFRGNTDESWQRALSWMLRNRLLAPPEAAR